MKNIIKWQKGVPKYNDKYIITYKYLGDSEYRNGVAEWCGKRWYVGTSVIAPQVDIIAWCPISEIEPYKEDLN